MNIYKFQLACGAQLVFVKNMVAILRQYIPNAMSFSKKPKHKGVKIRSVKTRQVWISELYWGLSLTTQNCPGFMWYRVNFLLSTCHDAMVYI